ncbi:MAG: ATP-binding protein [Nitrospirae bacterium]|nr:ATP-binding protein [Nitrospirota bacterium]
MNPWQSRTPGIRTILALVVAVLIVGLVGILGAVDEFLVRHNAFKILSREGRLVAQEFAFGVDMRHEADQFLSATVPSPANQWAHVRELVAIRREMSAVLAIRHNVTRVDLLSRQTGLPHIVSTSGTPMSPEERAAHDAVGMEHRPWVSVRERSKRDAIYVVVPFRHNNQILGTVGIRLSYYEIDALVRQEKERMAFILLAGFLLLMGGLSFALKRWLIDPTRDLERAMREVGEGDLSREFSSLGSSEIQRTGDSFNRMVDMLRERTREKELLLAEVRRLNAGLQDRILEKTRELQAKNQALAETNEAMYFLQRRLAELERRAAIGEGMAVVAHELGNPLHSIAGHLELLLEETNLPPSIESSLRIISGQADRMIKAIRKLLSLSRRSETPRDRIRIEPLLAEMERLVQPRLRATGVEVRMEMEPGGRPLEVRGDSDALQSLFLNLFENALDAAGDGGKIVVRAERTGSGVQIGFRDSGPGIPHSLRSRVFDPFFTTKPSGTGLGLAVCKKIAEDLGGAIHLGDGPGGEVIVLFPLDKGEEDVTPAVGSGGEVASRT